MLGLSSAEQLVAELRFVPPPLLLLSLQLCPLHSLQECLLHSAFLVPPTLLVRLSGCRLGYIRTAVSLLALLHSLGPADRCGDTRYVSGRLSRMDGLYEWTDRLDNATAAVLYLPLCSPPEVHLILDGQVEMGVDIGYGGRVVVRVVHGGGRLRSAMGGGGGGGRQGVGRVRHDGRREEEREGHRSDNETDNGSKHEGRR